MRLLLSILAAASLLHAQEGPLDLTLAQAIQRGLHYNFRAVAAMLAERDAAAKVQGSRGQLLPDVSGDLRENVQQVNLAAMGFKFGSGSFGGFRIPSIVGPFNYFDLRVGVSQSIADLSKLHNYRAAQENSRGVALRSLDTREVIVHTVTSYYLQVSALESRANAVRAQIVTAEAAHALAVSRNKAGLIARIDVNRTLLELQTQKQRLNALLNDVAKAKIELARFIALPQGEALRLADSQPFDPKEKLAQVDELIKQAWEQRPDVRVGASQVRAAEEARKAAAAEFLPTASMNVDYGVIGMNPAQSHGTFTLAGVLHVPIFRSGRTKADVEQATATLALRRAEYEVSRGRAEQDVRNALLDVDTATSQIQLAESNRKLAAETIDQARDRFGAGLADTLEVVQAQESLATADQTYIDAALSYQLARANLARAMGAAEKSIR